jgi:hypothetical protein
MGDVIGVGETVIVKVIGDPAQPFADGVTVIVATTGTTPAFVAVKDGIFPVPLAASPIEGSLFVQEKVVPATGLVKIIAVVVAPLQYTSLATGSTVVVGLIVIVNVIGVPAHPFAEGVTVIVATIGIVPAFVAMNEGIFPIPLAASPIEGSLFVQVNVVPATGLVKVIAVVVAPLQYTSLATGSTVVLGFTVIVKVTGVPAHPFADGVTVIVATTGTVPAFVAVKEGIFPVPLAASPMEGSVFVHVNVVPATVLVKFIAAVVAPLQ